MPDANRCTVRRALLLLGLLSATSLGSVAESWVERGPISPDDIPPGMYIALSMPPEVDSSWADLSFSDRNGTTRFKQRICELTSNMGELKDRYDVSKCYYFHTTRKILKFLTEKNGMREGTSSRGILLCTKKSSTKEKPALTLYLNAVRSSKRRYKELNLPVDLEPEAAGDSVEVTRKGAGSARRRYCCADDGVQPPRKKMKMTEYKKINDGFYADKSGEGSAKMRVETESDGQRRASVTLQVRDGSLFLFNALLVPAHHTGVFKLVRPGKTTQSEYTVYLCENDKLVIEGSRQKYTLIYMLRTPPAESS
ncbi:hypothetical protein FOZ63_032424 [Perkinsus olseni]|uniref:Uncharacterized protein n=1 Tax=Perkinsus olseni TaxID=32597 RepID=A0A7J6S9C9_PEROL|nr:hypothetical protein FOZ63_032424 [Perkinsus olseni]